MTDEEDTVPETTDLPGRNEPCHCGSGKKYKNCHLAEDEAAARALRAKEAAEAPAATEAAPAPERHHETPRRPQTQQPWKKSQNTRGMPRFNAPRKVGGS
ncbi:MAG TPA: SEC-C metal-binding domain-containing protein [Vicinamibacteria bacterium]